MFSKAKALYEKHRSVFWYLVTGGITTVTNIAVFWVLNGLLGVHYQAANVTAWVIAVAVAFCGNKWLAFRSEEKGMGLVKELISFWTMRVLTLGFETGFLYVAVDLLAWNALIAKVIDNIIVIVLNYVLSKLFVFRGKKG